MAKLGFRNFALFDDDKIESHNLPNQFYFTNQLGKEKTEALKEVMEMMSDDVAIVTKGRITKNTLLPYNIVITAMDNMKFRKIAFENSKKFSEVFIDARMGGQVFRLYTIALNNPEAINFYKSTLYSDKKSTQDTCTERSIMFNTMGIASFIGKNLTAILSNKPYYKGVVMDFYNMELTKSHV